MDYNNIVGKRERKQYIDPDYVYEEEIEQALKDMGISDETLKNDLRNSLSLEPKRVNIESAEFQVGGKTVTVYADPKKTIAGGCCIAEWLDKLDWETFWMLWTNPDSHGDIAALMRHPGGLHEWLMIAALPKLKEMRIPMQLVKDVRTSTAECCFYLNGKRCWHGEKGSWTMHRHLFCSINNAYLDVQKNGVNAVEALRKQLGVFAEHYYKVKGVWQEVPLTLAEFLGLPCGD